MYEFKAPVNFESGKWKTVTFMFVIDVSYTAVQMGFVQQILASIKNSLDYMPTSINLGFITYSTAIHFYTWQSATSNDPTSLYVNDIKNPFVPYPLSKLSFNLGKERAIIDSIIAKIGTLFEISKVKPGNGGCGGAALNCAMTVLKEAGGKIIMFCNEGFTNGYGALPSRDNSTLYNTDKEKSLKMPMPFYVDISNLCIKEKIGVDIFACNQNSIDFSTLAALCSLTGGEAYHYQTFNSLQGEKLYYDLFRILTRNYGFDAAFTVRSSIGLRASEYYGGFFTKTDKIVELSMLDSDKTIGVTLKVDGKLKPDTDSYVQFALLYTHVSGERRIRVINNVLTSTSNSTSLYSYIDGEATLNLMLKECVISLLKSNANDVKEKIMNQMCHMLWYYRVFVSQSAHSSQLVLPESLKFFPLYLLGLFKSQVFMSLKEVKLDQSISQLHFLISCHLPAFIKKLYPKLYQITNVTDTKSYCDNSEEVNMKPQNICTIKEKLIKTEAYLMDNGEYIYLFVGQEAPSEFIQQVLGIPDSSSLKNFVADAIPDLDSVGSKKLKAIIELLRKEKQGSFSPARIVVAGHGNTMSILYEMMTEDAIRPSDESYRGILSKTHGNILSLQSLA